jgi:hypothetical protein
MDRKELELEIRINRLKADLCLERDSANRNVITEVRDSIECP